MPLLTIAVVVPLLAAVVVALIPGRQGRMPLAIALLAAGVQRA